MKHLITFLALLATALSIDVHYHVWNQPNPSESNGNLRATIGAPEGSTFKQVMDIAALNNKNFEYEFDEFPFGIYVTSIGGVKEDPGRNIYWMLYQVNGEPSPNNPPEDRNQTSTGPSDLRVNHNDIYLFWRKSISNSHNK